MKPTQPLNDLTLYPQENWDADYSGLESFNIVGKDDPVRKWLETHIPPKNGSCLELGCFPGKYLAVLGKLGYELNGVDLTPRVDTDMHAWLADQGYRMGEIKRADIWKLEPNRQFDLVCSFGLIEHFIDWPQLLKRHAELVCPGGKLVITVPNFRGWLQRVVHELADVENLRKHNLDAMDPIRWLSVLPESDWKVEFCGWFGGCSFWMGSAKRNIFEKICYRLAWKMARFLNPILPSNKACAVCCGIILQRAV